MTMMQILWILVLALAMAMCAVAYLRSHARFESGVFHKAGCYLLYAYLKMSLAFQSGMHYMKTCLAKIFAGYQPGEAAEGICRKQQRMQELHREISCKGYAKSRHNLKILE